MHDHFTKALPFKTYSNPMILLEIKDQVSICRADEMELENIAEMSLSLASWILVSTLTFTFRRLGEGVFNREGGLLQSLTSKYGLIRERGLIEKGAL